MEAIVVEIFYFYLSLGFGGLFWVLRGKCGFCGFEDREEIFREVIEGKV